MAFLVSMMASDSRFEVSRDVIRERRVSMSDCEVELEDLSACSSFSRACRVVSGPRVRRGETKKQRGAQVWD